MNKSEIVSVSLASDDVVVLDRMARKAGSRSAAVRQLIAIERKTQLEREIEEAYREFYSDPNRIRENAELTEDMKLLSSWLGYRPNRGKRGANQRSSR